MRTRNEVFEQLKAKWVAPVVEKVIKDQAPPPNSLEPKQVWEEKTRAHLLEEASGQPLIDKMTEGFEAIVENLNPVEMEKLSEEWQRGVELWVEKAHSKEELAPPPDCLQEIMEISEETIKRFYDAGNFYFEHQDYRRASDVFYVVVSLDPRRYNVWMALGLSEVHQEHWEAAIESFSLASVMDIDSPYPYLYSAECCLRDNRKDEATVFAGLAKEAVEKGQFKNKQDLFAALEKFK